MSTHNNRLVHENSPYLLQHAHNPVDWYPWGKEALERAKKEDKPILVSIGYSACHWCHVMERESFENEDTAALMNEYFINIKIDREERPDLDHIYMDAVQAMTGSGGWPLNVFLTPEGKPFYGGTYFPPVRAYNRASWPEVLKSIHKAYSLNKNDIEAQAENLTEHIKKANAVGSSDTKVDQSLYTDETLDIVAENLLKTADTEWGGFGKAPKFPQTFSIINLLRHFHYTKHQSSLDQALLSLDKMIYGGIYDQLGGGFARYSTDEKWLAPHFEKMLYDNALIISAMAEAYQLTQFPLYKNTIDHTMEFIKREMLSREGGFYSAIDADSEGVEGKFYTWQKAEIDELLGEESGLFCEYYNIEEEGNWEHTNILWVKNPPENFAQEKGITIDELNDIISEASKKLFSHRDKRIRPQLDDKILLSWNALMVTACCKAYAATGYNSYKELATDNMLFLERVFKTEEGTVFFHTYKGGNAKYPAFLDDYAYLAEAYIHLQEITGEASYLAKGKEIVEIVIKHFGEEETGFFFFTSDLQEDVIVRKKEVYDGATPSGNSVMAFNLFYLGMIYDLPEWKNRALRLVSATGAGISRHPGSFGNWACVLRMLSGKTNEIAIVGKNSPDLLKEILKLFLPGSIIQSSVTRNDDFPLLKGKDADEEANIFVCKGYACNKPVKNVKEFKALLK